MSDEARAAFCEDCGLEYGISDGEIPVTVKAYTCDDCGGYVGVEVPKISPATVTLDATIPAVSIPIGVVVGLADPRDRWLVESWIHWKFRLWRTSRGE